MLVRKRCLVRIWTWMKLLQPSNLMSLVACNLKIRSTIYRQTSGGPQLPKIQKLVQLCNHIIQVGLPKCLQLSRNFRLHNSRRAQIIQCLTCKPKKCKVNRQRLQQTFIEINKQIRFLRLIRKDVNHPKMSVSISLRRHVQMSKFEMQ